MATPDHKALVRPPNPPGGTSNPTLGRPHHSPDTAGESRQQVDQYLAAINAAMNDIVLVVVNSEEARRAKSRGKPMRRGLWPLSPLCAENLMSAIRFLNHYAKSLRHEPGVDP